MKKDTTTLFLSLWLVLFIQPGSAFAAQKYLERQEVHQYIEQVAKTHQYDIDRLRSLIGSVTKQDRTIELLDAPAEAKPWYEYRKIFMTRKRILEGILFWHENNALLKQVSEHYRVAPEIIIALIGVETFYGRITGQFPILDTLVTLSFDYPRREKFFRKELTQFLLLCREESIDCKKARGSHGGAMGTGQFISSSYRNYAVDFDKDGQRDLWQSKPDILASVANYIARHGWTKGAPVAELTTLPAQPFANILNKNLKPWLTADSLVRSDALEKNFVAQEKSFTLLGMKTSEKHTDIWAGYHNFYVISRYNHSRLYSLVVYELSQAIKRDRKR